MNDFRKQDFKLLDTDDTSNVSNDKMECLRLYSTDNLNYETIAGKMGVAVGTVKSRINRARHQILKNRSKETT